MVFAVVTGGGTSGHVIPAIAVIEALEDAGIAPSQLRYVGAKRGIETRLMRDVDVEAQFLPISGLQRSLAPRHIWANLMLPWRLLRSTFLARALMKSWKPQVVVSLGGYASEPMARAAKSAGVPLVCVSYDRTPGLATKRQQRYATSCAVAFADSPLRKAVHTGAPVRRSIRTLNRNTFRDTELSNFALLPESRVVTIVGGSLGSAVLNDSAQSIVDGIVESNMSNVVVIHICGERFMSTPEPRITGAVTYKRFGYTDQMDSIYALTDVLVCRAGASTVAEIATLGLCSVVIPWKDAADNHQELNARWLANANAAVMLTESQCTGTALADTVVELLHDESRRTEIQRAAYDLGRLHRSNALVDLITSVAKNDLRSGTTKDSLL